MRLKYNIPVQVLASEVNDFAADSDFTTDFIKWSDFSGFALNVWFPLLVGTNPSPTIDVEVSNTEDLLSFKPLINSVGVELVNLPVPQLWEIVSIEAEYIRFKYKSIGVDATSVVNFDLNRLAL